MYISFFNRGHSTSFCKHVHIPQKVLCEMDNKTVNTVRKWLCLNTHSARCFIFQKKQDRGLGVPNCMWEYTATRQSHLTNMAELRRHQREANGQSILNAGF